MTQILPFRGFTVPLSASSMESDMETIDSHPMPFQQLSVYGSM